MFEKDQLVTVSQESGRIYVLHLSPGNHTLTFYHQDFAPFTTKINFHSATTFMNVTLMSLRVYHIDTSKAVTFIDEVSQAKFEIPYGSIVDRNGVQYLGNLTAKVGFVNASNTENLNSITGEPNGYYDGDIS